MWFTIKTIILVLFQSVLFAAKQVADLDDVLEDEFKEAFIKPKITPEYPELLAHFRGGDVNEVFDKDDFVENNDGKRKFGVMQRNRRWPNGRVPYVIVGPYPENLTLILNETILYFQTVTTCVNFVKWNETLDHDYVRFIKHLNSCSSRLGYHRGLGNHDVRLDFYCFNRWGTVLHEMMHALGFEHEHMRPDRDSYVTIIKENVIPENLVDLEKLLSNDYTNLSLPYDYSSVMHFPKYAYTINGNDTIVPLFPNDAIHMGQRGSLSNLDVKKLNKMYC